MPNHKITNTTSSMLDMSPLKDLLGRTLTLRAKEERDVDDKTFHDDIVQRVVKAGWVMEVAALEPVAVPADDDVVPPDVEVPAAEVVPPEAEVPAAEVPAEPAPLPEPEPPVAEAPHEPEPPAMPVETPVITETPIVETSAPSSKSGKRK